MKDDRKACFMDWVPVLGTLLIQPSIGMIHQIGSIAIYTVSFMRAHGDNLVRLKDVGWIYASGLLMYCLASHCSNAVKRRLGNALSMAIGCACISAGIYLSSFSCRNLLEFILTYGILTNIGTGLCFNISVDILAKSLPERLVCRAMGILLFFRSTSLLLFTYFQASFLNRDNLKPTGISVEFPDHERYFVDNEMLSRLPKFFVLQSKILLGLQVAGIPLMFLSHVAPSKPEEYSGVRSIEPVAEDEDGPVLSDGELLTSAQFMHSLAAFFPLWIAAAYVQAYWKIVGSENQALRDADVTIAGLLALFASMMGRLIWGWIGDHHGISQSLVCLNFIVAIFMMTLPLSTTMGLSAFALWLCVLFLCFGGSSTLLGPAIYHNLGLQNFGVAYAWLSLFRVLASILMSGFIEFSYDLVGSRGICLLCSCGAATSCIVSIWYSSRYRRLSTRKKGRLAKITEDG